MKKAYKSKEVASENIEKDGKYMKNEQQILALITIKEEVIKLRGQVQLRFFSRAADNLGHAQRILMLQDQIRSVEKHLVQRDVSLGSSTDPPVQLTQTPADDHKEHVTSKGPSLSGKPTTEDKKVELVYRSVLSQQVPIEGLSHLESDHPVHVVKRFMVDKLLEIAPALDDNLDPEAAEDDPDAADDTMSSTVVRNWFRRLVLARGQPDVLDLASRHTTIIGFLRSGVEVGELRQYVEYFENVDGDALRHLRRAIGDSFLTVNRPTINLLGGSVSTDDEIEELSTEKWDMVFNRFENVIPWDLLPCLYMSFADNLHLSKLLLLNRYWQD